MSAKYQKIEKLFKTYCTLATSFLLALFITSTFFPVEGSGAIACIGGSTGTSGQVCDTASSDISVTVENPYYITVTSSAGSGSGIALDYTAESGNKLGTVVTATDTVTTTSNTGQIKHLYISTSSSSNNLTNGDTDLENNKTYISAGGGDTLAGATTLSDNTWGFNIESNNNFTKVPTLGNDMVIQEEIGTENTETGEYESTQNVYFGALATSALNAGKYSNTILYTAFTTEPPEEEPVFEGITTMQELTSEICKNAEIGDATQLLDSRGYGNAGADKITTYGVLKAADGNCWMTDNLNLYNITIQNATSDFNTGIFNIPNTTNYGADCKESSGNYCGDKARLHVANGTGSSASSDSKYYGQVYYNWCSATALDSGCTTTAEQDQSICPKNWKIPKGGTDATDTATNASWPKLMNTYKALNGGALTCANLATTDASAVVYPLGFRFYYGNWRYDIQSEYAQGNFSSFWSSKPIDSRHAREVYCNPGNVVPYDYNSKGLGYSVRCVVPVN